MHNSEKGIACSAGQKGGAVGFSYRDVFELHGRLVSNKQGKITGGNRKTASAEVGGAYMRSTL